VAALLGAAGGYLLQYYAHVLSYPLDTGGRPLNSVPSFMQVTFEMLVLTSALVTTAAFLYMSRLPKLHHRVFSMPGFGESTDDRFLVVVETETENVDVGELLRSAGALEVRND
jgi:hypothetical protein